MIGAATRSIGLLGQRVVLLVGVAIALAAVTNVASPNGIPWSGGPRTAVEAEAIQLKIATVDLDTARQIVEAASHTVLDARSAARFAEGHLPGALSLPLEAIDEGFQSLQLLLKPEHPILVYCSGAACDESLQLAKFLKEQGYTEVSLFAGGYEAWKAAGLPTENGV